MRLSYADAEYFKLSDKETRIAKAHRHQEGPTLDQVRRVFRCMPMAQRSRKGTGRKRPFYFEQYNPGVPCEPFGFLCDVYILCLHPIEDSRTADQSDPDQWEFYVVPVAPTRSIYPLVLSADVPLNQAIYTVVPESLRKGIRGRPPIEPVRFHELTEARVRQALGL